jgi:spoIIIJ-associated protein
MSSIERRFFSAENLERAVLEAAGHFGVDPQQLRYERVDKRSGFTKRRRVVIRVDPARLILSEEEAAQQRVVEHEPEAPQAPQSETATPPHAERETPAEPASAVPAEPLSELSVAASASAGPAPEPAGGAVATRWQDLPRTPRESLAAQTRAPRDVEESARRWLGLLLQLADLDLQATIRQGGDRLDIGLEGVDSEWLVEDEGEALQALQTLLPRLLDGDAEESGLCRIDCNGFQELREERLRTRAHRAAAEVRRTGERAILEPMMPADRRIVHLALLNDSSVTTESLGRGFFKRVTIKRS